MDTNEHNVKMAARALIARKRKYVTYLIDMADHAMADIEIARTKLGQEAPAVSEDEQSMGQLLEARRFGLQYTLAVTEANRVTHAAQ